MIVRPMVRGAPVGRWWLVVAAGDAGIVAGGGLGRKRGCGGGVTHGRACRGWVGGGGGQLYLTLGLGLQFRLFGSFLLLGGRGTRWGVGEVERPTCGGAGVYGDPVMVRGVDVGAGGGPREEGLEGGGWHGHEVGVLSYGRSRDCDGGTQVVGERGCQLLDI